MRCFLPSPSKFLHFRLLLGHFSSVSVRFYLSSLLSCSFLFPRYFPRYFAIFIEKYLCFSYPPLFGDAFSLNRVIPYQQTAPLLIYQGALDEVTPESHTTQVVDALQASGVTVDYQIVSDGHHTDVAFGPLANPQIKTQDSITTLRQHLSSP